MDPLQTETARFWENHGDYNDVDAAKIQTEVFQLPDHLLRGGRGFAGEFRPLAAVALAGATPPHEATQERRLDHVADLYLRCCKALYQKEGGTCPGPDPEPDLERTRTRRADARRNSPRSSTAARSPT